jgi:hypothetical protein
MEIWRFFNQINAIGDHLKIVLPDKVPQVERDKDLEQYS